MAAAHISAETATPLEHFEPASAMRQIRVTEHLLSFMSRGRIARSDLVNDIESALHISWISKVPGEKLIEMWHGQLVVMQRYLGYKIVRAHIEVPRLKANVESNTAAVDEAHSAKGNGDCLVARQSMPYSETARQVERRND